MLAFSASMWLSYASHVCLCVEQMGEICEPVKMLFVDTLMSPRNLVLDECPALLQEVAVS